MKQMKFAFIAIALIGICSAFVTQNKTNVSIKKFGVLYEDNGRVYLKDVTGQSESQSTYTCDQVENELCTFTYDVPETNSKIIEDESGIYFETSNFDPTTDPDAAVENDDAGFFDREL